MTAIGRLSDPRLPLLNIRTVERVLSVGAIAMLVAVLTALARGYAQWSTVPLMVWAHLATIIGALSLTPSILLRRRGDRVHRVLGYSWLTCMGLTAALSFAIRTSPTGGLSRIHILSAITLAVVPAIVVTARTGRIRTHQRIVCSLTLSALLIAGFFTFPFGRMLGRWLLS